MEQEILEEEVGLEEEDDSPENTDIDLNSLSDRKLGEKMEKPNLDGKIVTISKVELKATNDVKLTKDGTKKYKPVLFRVWYDDEVYENYGGVQQFEHDGKYGEPTIWTEGNSNAAKLFKLWVAAKEVAPDEVSLKQFFTDLKGKKVKLRHKEAEFEGREYKKNVVVEFTEI